MKRLLALAAAGAALCTVPGLVAQAERPIRLPLDPVVSPDGTHVAFSWQRDVWIAATGVRDLGASGRARRLTYHPASDQTPHWSPDGGTIAFTSDRAGALQVFTVPIAGGAPTQLTFDSLGKTLFGYHPDGEHVLLGRRSDTSPFRPESSRLYACRLDGEGPEKMLFDCGFSDAAVSPDGSKILFTRGRSYRTRKGYRGPQALQMWLAERSEGGETTVRRLSEDRDAFQNVAQDHPMWLPDNAHYLFTADPGGADDLFLHTTQAVPGDGAERVTDSRALFDGGDDGVEDPSISADGRYVVYRRLFDLRVLDRETGKDRALPLTASGDLTTSSIERQSIKSARSVAFTSDGKQIAFVAGHDLYVMDRILKEPIRLTDDVAIETSLLFSEDGKHLMYVSECSGEADIWRASISREDGVWWLAEPGEVSLEKLTDDKEVESNLRRSPTGEKVAYTRDSELFVMDADGTDRRRLVSGWDTPDFDWSPDGEWIVYSQQDDDFNSEIWILKLDGTEPPFNVSCHPDRDGSPVWSPDGKRIAWTGRRTGEEMDIWYVTVQKDAAEETGRDRRLKKALAAMGIKPNKKAEKDAKAAEASVKAEDAEAKDPEAVATKAPKKKDLVVVDLEGMRDRIRRISIADSYESGLIWSPSGNTLLFQASVGGSRGVYKVEFPDKLRPSKFSSAGLGSAEWLAKTKEIVGLSGGVPATAKGSKIEKFDFSVRQARDWRAVRQAAFDQGWRAMRDRFYDPELNDRDWDAVRKKYRDVAGQLLGRREFSLLMNMMLGELNASHMGHRGGSDPLPTPTRPGWSLQTYELGGRYEVPADGPGLLVSSVIPGSPISLARSKVEPGERILSLDGQELGADSDLIELLTMAQVHDIELKVQSVDGEERTVTVRPATSGTVRAKLYEEWVANNREQVEEWSGGKLGYLHIQGMNSGSFLQLEEDLYAAGYGKEGLIIDVRYNGGGSTADKVLTVLTQPRHAFTIPRNGGEGYPQDRKVYASWHKPIVLMCNEHSFSNAEILSHAINTLDRGPVVGMRTAGGVISTGGQGLMDGSMVRMPFRGWFLKKDGQDMELNGAMPDYALWNDPASDVDAQLQKAVEVLGDEVSGFVDHAEAVPASFRRSQTNR